MKPYYILRKELIFHEQKLVITHCLRRSVLRLAHEGLSLSGITTIRLQ